MCDEDSYLYDPVASAYIINPDLFQTEFLPISVVSEGENSGQTVEDKNGVLINVALDLEQNKFHELLKELIELC
ncbi:hypothetical protein FJR38_26415 [Anabaena sp. UHCC 0253]|uniref:hypothetical protein n=1 Tax=Anabaena sp. UHCC 0253 TaxID=2590019 RepID=UPI0014453D69|nr:hypothetical protein [Anabaena sp. UHCC 0253]MTJ55940.1 hypothetical protein [Anabaena sp. UHCC 0253]